MSNLQDVEKMNTPHMKSTIAFIKKELQTSSTTTSSDKFTNKESCFNFCKNALTESNYSFEKGSNEERNLFTVMPIDGKEKIYFDSYEEYKTLSKKNKKQNKLLGTQIIKGIKAN